MLRCVEHTQRVGINVSCEFIILFSIVGENINVLGKYENGLLRSFKSFCYFVILKKFSSFCSTLYSIPMFPKNSY